MQLSAHALLVALSLQIAILSHSAAESRAHPLFGFAIEGLPTQAALKTLKKATGIQAPLVMIYLQWPSRAEGGVFPGETLHAIEASGAVPVLTWEPMFVDPENNERAIPAESITAGKYDVYLQRFARESRKFEKPFLIRFAHEMNLARYHWGGTPQEFGPQSAARYRDMFRYVVAVFRAQKADNVRWTFCPNAESVPAESWNQITSYYPGDDVVDVIGIDGYNWGTTQTRSANGWASEWRSFGSIFTGPIQDLHDVASGKPTAVFETSSASEGGNKEEWVLDALDSARSLGLAAVIWFEVNKEIDWRLETNVSEGVRAAINHDNLSISSARSLLSR